MASQTGLVHAAVCFNTESSIYYMAPVVFTQTVYHMVLSKKICLVYTQTTAIMT